MNTPRRLASPRILAAVVLSLLSGSTLSAHAAEPSLSFRGAGQTRQTLDQMQLKAFDAKTWDELSGWVQGEKPTAQATEGNVVLICTWASWYKGSHQGARNAQKLFDRYKDQGLVVVGVHNPRGTDDALESAKTLGLMFPIAQDKDGKFRTALHADQDPNFYVIDRAGRLRYAQVDSGSVEKAVETLLAESAQQARDIPANLEKAQMDAEQARRRTKDSAGLLPGQFGEVNFEDPDEDAYKKTPWPQLLGKIEQDKISGALTVTQPKINLPEEDWAPANPKMRGKLVLAYFIDPALTDMIEAIPVMNRLQDRYGRDVQVVALAVKIDELKAAGNDADATKITERNKGLVQTLQKTVPMNHPVLLRPVKVENFEFKDMTGKTINELVTRWVGEPRRGMFVVISTDHKVQSVGSPFEPSLPAYIDRILAVDPGVLARRKAEDAKIKTLRSPK